MADNRTIVPAGPEGGGRGFPATSAPLLAASFLLENECKSINDSFMACRYDNDDPEKCAKLAQSVLDCSLSLFQKIGASKCRESFENFWRCLDMNNQDFIYCRKEEFILLKCTKESLGLSKRLWKEDRPENGLKEEFDRPEVNSWRYQMHVWSNKNSYQ